MSERRSLSAQKHTLKWDKEEVRRLFRRYREEGDSYARDELIANNLSLVRYLASKFRNRGEPLEGLVQVGTIGLIKAIERFDLDRNLEFTTYATPTILGEIKRHFRDKGWAVKVPRRMQELSAQVNRATDELAMRNQCAPTIDEIALELGVTTEEVIDALDASEAYATTSFDSAGVDDDQSSYADRFGAYDSDIYRIEEREVLDEALGGLDKLSRDIIRMRFFDERTQTDIAQELGISQMQVSRILRRSIETLKNELSI